jgi:hypothetical protein
VTSHDNSVTAGPRGVGRDPLQPLARAAGIGPATVHAGMPRFSGRGVSGA